MQQFRELFAEIRIANPSLATAVRVRVPLQTSSVMLMGTVTCDLFSNESTRPAPTTTRHRGQKHAMTNKQITLAARPAGFPQSTDFRLVESAIPKPADGQILVRTKFLSVDPYMRGRMSDAKSYAEPVEIGDVMVGECVAEVIESNNKRFPVGTFVSGMFGWQEYALSDGKMLRKLDANIAPISTALHCLGMPGMTAYFGLNDVCKAEAGQTVVVSGAAGAVGSVVGQLAKQKGCRVIGIAGSEEKIQFLDELGFDGGFNYKTTEDYYQALKQLCPDGIDAYFDNVGGPITDSVFPLLTIGARIAICGQISQYNAESRQEGPRVLWNLIIKRATIQGFLVMDFTARFREAIAYLTQLHVEGKLKYRETISEGIENAPMAFMEMMQGANIGKQLVKVDVS